MQSSLMPASEQQNCIIHDYSPIRFKIMSSGKMSFIIHRVQFEYDYNCSSLLHEQSSITIDESIIDNVITPI